MHLMEKKRLKNKFQLLNNLYERNIFNWNKLIKTGLMNGLLNGLLNNVTCYCTVIAAHYEMVCVYKKLQCNKLFQLKTK